MSALVTSVEDFPLNMANRSFDDQYKGCEKDMRNKVLKTLLKNELEKNADFKTGWKKGEGSWERLNKKVPLPPGMLKDHAVAIQAYTCGSSLYKTFNAAVRTNGTSLKEYQNRFLYKSLHFLLTDAVRILKKREAEKCHEVYRGATDSFSAKEGERVRFGQFASSSLSEKVAKKFGNVTAFKIKTCLGIPLGNLSALPHEKEVLIPPFEVFRVVSVKNRQTGRSIRLVHSESFSKFNCALIKKPRRGKIVFI
ncbi:erythroblast NAD(P)(+)--arginine ADP-ribosyltransferase-like isoform X2 [Acipenser ruthenus]|uniref:erythroblast NAD(P)(+)--arginine ADP-ribosyltransferase-like isoform X2 n=1 Tax=Acipenser ruthenus TaxID=7906 RepID=UPI0027418CCA|nr:erythroblast NAD(P)(+)--arginine ADP-ribosyltransferase-like isoform X2 [Acipenser ruthenus]